MPVRYFPALFVVLWATGFIGARYAMPYMEPFLFLTARFLIAGAILGVWVVLAGNHWPSKRGAMHAIIAGCLIHGVYLGAVFWAIHNGLPAGMSALVVGLQPLITALIAGLALGEKIQPRHWAGLAVGFYGVAMVLWPKLSISADGITPATVSAVDPVGHRHQCRHGLAETICRRNRPESRDNTAISRRSGANGRVFAAV